MVRVEGLTFSYAIKKRHFQVLDDINFHLQKNNALCLIGPSGCGKTTLLYAIAGLRMPEAGNIYINDLPVNGPREKTAIIFQHFGLLPWKTVFDNIALGMKIRSSEDRTIKSLVDSTMDQLGIAALSKKYPKHLSGGEKQRVAIARALVLRPDLLLLDEPFSAIDALTRESLQESLIHVWKKWQLTIIHVTHDIEEAVFLGTEVLLMGRDGSIKQSYKVPGEKGPDFRDSPQFHQATAVLRKYMRGVIDETPC